MCSLPARLMLWWGLGVALLLSVAPASALVICFEVDGSARFETALAALCCAETETSPLDAPPPTPSLSSDLDQACPCVDVALVPASAELRCAHRSLAPREAGAGILSSAFARVPARLAPTGRLANHGVEQRPLVGGRARSVVLLI